MEHHFRAAAGIRRPNTDDEGAHSPVQFKDRVRVSPPSDNDPSGDAFMISWFSTTVVVRLGYGWPKQHSDIDQTDFDGLALELIYSFVRDIFVTWHTRGERPLK